MEVNLDWQEGGVSRGERAASFGPPCHIKGTHGKKAEKESTKKAVWERAEGE